MKTAGALNNIKQPPKIFLGRSLARKQTNKRTKSTKPDGSLPLKARVSEKHFGLAVTSMPRQL